MAQEAASPVRTAAAAKSSGAGGGTSGDAMSVAPFSRGGGKGVESFGSMAALGQWIQQLTVEGLARMQLSAPPAPPSSGSSPAARARRGQKGRTSETGTRKRRSVCAELGTGGPPPASTPTPLRRQTSALASAMRRRGGVQRSYTVPALTDAESKGGDAEGALAGHAGRFSELDEASAAAEEKPLGSPERGGGLRPPQPQGASFFGEFRDFLHRGGMSSPPPRTPTSASRMAGARREDASQHALSHVQRWFSCWAAEHELSPEQVRLIAARSLQYQEAGSEADRNEDMTTLEVSVVVHGVEVMAKVSVSPSLDSSAELTTVVADTHCRWEAARRRVRSVARATRGLPLEELLRGLLEEFGGQAFPGNASSAAACDRAEDATISRTPSSGGAHEPSNSGAALDGVVGDARDAEEEEPEDHDGGERCGLADSFMKWLSGRPPLLRFEHASVGMSWDFPLTRAEKHELLLLQLFSQEAERRAELQAVRVRTSIAPSTAESAAARGARASLAGSSASG